MCACAHMHIYMRTHAYLHAHSYAYTVHTYWSAYVVQASMSVFSKFILFNRTARFNIKPSQL